MKLHCSTIDGLIIIDLVDIKGRVYSDAFNSNVLFQTIPQMRPVYRIPRFQVRSW